MKEKLECQMKNCFKLDSKKYKKYIYLRYPWDEAINCANKLFPHRYYFYGVVKNIKEYIAITL